MLHDWSLILKAPMSLEIPLEGWNSREGIVTLRKETKRVIRLRRKDASSLNVAALELGGLVVNALLEEKEKTTALL